MTKSIRNYIFDLDGTIVNSSNEILLCLKKAFNKAGYVIDEKKLTSELIGPPIKQIIKSIDNNIEDETILEKIINNFRTEYDNDENDISVLYDNVYEKLVELKSTGKRLFLATLKPYKPTMRVINEFHLNIFDDIYSINKFDKIMSKAEMIADILQKYKLKKDETVMIGDALSDMEAAKINNITFIAALWGYEKEKDKLMQCSDFSIDNIGELQ